MAVTPLRIITPQNLSGGPSTLYTVPANTKTVVNYIHVQNPTSSDIGLTLSIGTDSASTRIYDNTPFPPGASPIFCNHVLEAGEFLQGFASNSALVLTVDADQRTL
jgi:hypothetical protein